MSVVFNHVAVASSDEEQARLFYGELLGLQESYRFEVPAKLAQQIFNLNDNLKVLVFSAGFLKLEVFILPKPEAAVPMINHICLDVDNRTQLLNNLRRHGIEVLEIQREHGTTVFVKDFYGNLLEIKEIQKNEK